MSVDYSFLSPFEPCGDVPLELGRKALGGARATGPIFDTNGGYNTVVKPGSAAVKLAGKNFSLIILCSTAIHGSSKTTSHLHGIRLTTTLQVGCATETLGGWGGLMRLPEIGMGSRVGGQGWQVEGRR